MFIFYNENIISTQHQFLPTGETFLDAVKMQSFLSSSMESIFGGYLGAKQWFRQWWPDLNPCFWNDEALMDSQQAQCFQGNLT